MYCWCSFKKSSKSEQMMIWDGCLSASPGIFHLTTFFFSSYRRLACHNMSIKTWLTSWRDCGLRCAGRSVWQMFAQSVQIRCAIQHSCDGVCFHLATWNSWLFDQEHWLSFSTWNWPGWMRIFTDKVNHSLMFFLFTVFKIKPLMPTVILLFQFSIEKLTMITLSNQDVFTKQHIYGH